MDSVEISCGGSQEILWNSNRLACVSVTTPDVKTCSTGDEATDRLGMEIIGWRSILKQAHHPCVNANPAPLNLGGEVHQPPRYKYTPVPLYDHIISPITEPYPI